MNNLEKKADRLFSDFIRNRDGWCQLADAECWGDLHAHHLIFKSQDPGHRVRWDPRNGLLVCAAHHQYLHEHPLVNASVRAGRLGASLPKLLAKAYGGPKPDVAAIVKSLRDVEVQT